MGGTYFRGINFNQNKHLLVSACMAGDKCCVGLSRDRIAGLVWLRKLFRKMSLRTDRQTLHDRQRQEQYRG